MCPDVSPPHEPICRQCQVCGCRDANESKKGDMWKFSQYFSHLLHHAHPVDGDDDGSSALSLPCHGSMAWSYYCRNPRLIPGSLSRKHSGPGFGDGRGYLSGTPLDATRRYRLPCYHVQGWCRRMRAVRSHAHVMVKIQMRPGLPSLRPAGDSCISRHLAQDQLV